MIEKNKISLVANDVGNVFYEKWRKDTKLSIIMAPIGLTFFLGCFTMIVGISLKLFLVSLFPVVTIVVSFIYVPFFVRKKFINNLVRNIVIEDDRVFLITYQWFTYKSICVSLKTTELEVKESTTETFFEGKTVFILKLKDLDTNKFYLVEEFFDNNVGFIKLLNK